MNNLRHKQKTLCLIGTLIAMFGVAWAQPAVQASAQASKTTALYGTYTVFGLLQSRTGMGPKAIVTDLTGEPVQISSAKYDMAAPKIHVELTKGGTPPRYKATEAIATGSVRLVVRNAAAHQTTTITCDHAEFHSTTAPKDRGHIEMTGHVHSETRDPALDGPAIQDSDTGRITFPDADTTVIELTNTAAKATAIEPQQPAKKKAQP